MPTPKLVEIRSDGHKVFTRLIEKRLRVTASLGEILRGA